MFEAQGWATNDDVRNRIYFFETMDGNSFFFFFVCLLLNIVQFVCLFLFNIIITSRGRTLLFLPKKKKQWLKERASQSWEQDTSPLCIRWQAHVQFNPSYSGNDMGLRSFTIFYGPAIVYVAGLSCFYSCFEV